MLTGAYTSLGIHSKTVIAKHGNMETATLVEILNKADTLHISLMPFGEGMNPTISLQLLINNGADLAL